MAFWARQGSNQLSSTELVTVPGDSGSNEKGVDVAITTFMFETADHWSSVCIVSDDADFVPAIYSLKRRGKKVFCAVSPRASLQIVQVSTSHYKLCLPFIDADFSNL